VPGIEKYRSFEEALAYCREEGLKILLWEKEGKSLKEVLKKDLHRRIYLMVGPEGGFTKEEVGLAAEKRFIPVKLGQRILRTETAAITLIGILQYELGDLG
jgi:16S rRNA (uracil1498-N3)-methyltransferase